MNPQSQNGFVVGEEIQQIIREKSKAIRILFCNGGHDSRR